MIWKTILRGIALLGLIALCVVQLILPVQAGDDPAKADEPIVLQGAGQQPPPKAPQSLMERFKIPGAIPGSNAGVIPREVSSKDKADREAAVDRLYPPLPPQAPLPTPQPGPEDRPLTLADLEAIALKNSPLIRQAAADVHAARGTAIQVGLWPNPTVAYSSSQVKPGLNAGQQGVFIEQIIKTAFKPGLARAAAGMDVLNAEVALRRAEFDLRGQVRSGYYAILVALANLRVNQGLLQLTENVYRIQVDQLKGGLAAAYEPMQLRVGALQARTAVIQAHNRYVSAWKQLASSLGLPGMPLTQVAGQADMPIPRADYGKSLARVLDSHTDVRTAENTRLRARYNLRLAQLTRIPDIDAQATFQHDNSDGRDQYGLQIGFAVPLWDRNQGNILAAEGALGRAIEEGHRVIDDLSSRLADAFERYENNRIILEYYRTQILPDQVRAYRGVYERHTIAPNEVSFGDVVNAQQTLVTTIGSYLTALAAQWQAVVDLANLLQLDDLSQLGDTQCVAAIPDLDVLAPGLCSPGDMTHLPPDTSWPPAELPAQTLPEPKAIPDTKP